MLDFLRATVVMKVEGLTDEQAFAPAVPPSTLTLAGPVGGPARQLPDRGG